MSGTAWALTIGEQSELRFGNKKSWLTVLVTNKSSSRSSPGFSLTLPPAFVANTDDIEFLDGSNGQNVFAVIEKGAAETTWKIGDRSIEVPAGGSAAIKLASINPVSAGTFQLPVKWLDSGGEVRSSLQVTVQSGGEWPAIVTFAAEDEVFEPYAGAKITLHWNVSNADIVALFRQGKQVLPLPGDKTAGNQGRWEDPETDRATGLQSYQIKAWKNGNLVSDWVFVRIQNPGWNRLPKCPEGKPVAMMNDHDQRLYGVFLKDRIASLYLLDASRGTLGAEDLFLKQLPPGLETSPGAFFNHKIWIAGGSQIDPNVCSNTVWWFDPLTKESGSAQASWEPRMGHALLASDDALWIIGGADAAGNTLADVYRSANGADWVKLTNQAPALCMAGATVQDGRLWLCGGTADVFGVPQKLLWYLSRGTDPSWKDAAWTKMNFRGGVKDPPFSELPYGDPFALALTPGKLKGADVLCGVGTFNAQQSGIVSRKFTVKGIISNVAELQPDDSIRESEVWATTVDGADVQQPFRLTATQFKSLIFVVSLVFGSKSTSLTYLVQATAMRGALR